MKNLLFAVWKNSSRHKIGQFEYINLPDADMGYAVLEAEGDKVRIETLNENHN